MNNTIAVSKENLPYISFVDSGVQPITILEKLERARSLGNRFKGKCKLFFSTSDGIKWVETTVWSLADDYVVLKGDIVIPTYALVDVSF